MNDRRKRIVDFLAALAVAALAAIGARYGIPVPPLPPITVEPPPVILPPSPTLPPGSEPDARPDPAKALVRLSFGNVGCTGTVIGPRRVDGRYWILTAAHCVNRIGQQGTFRLLDGRTGGMTVVSFDKSADCCWCVTSNNSDVYPFALLAGSSPQPGTKIWHAGYGVDRPGNREEGEVTHGPDSNGQIRMTLSVSSGDSGGGIIATADGKVISCVCCTSNRGGIGDVWGTSPEAAIRNRPNETVLDDWKPIDVPIRMPPKE